MLMSVLPPCMCSRCIPGAYKSKKRVISALELELQMAWIAIWVLELKLGTPGRAPSVLNPWAITLASVQNIFEFYLIFYWYQTFPYWVVNISV